MRKTVTLEYRPGTCTDSGAAEKTRAGQNAVYLVVVPTGVGKGAGGEERRKEWGKGVSNLNTKRIIPYLKKF
jgi:hypothetical protein